MPLGESMQSILKSNKNIMLDRSKHFRKVKSKHSINKNIEYNFPEADTKILKAIKSKLKKDQKSADRILFILLILILIIGAVIMIYLIS